MLSSLKYIKTGILSHFWLKKPRNRVTWEHVRGFESLSLRHKKRQTLVCLFLWRELITERDSRDE